MDQNTLVNDEIENGKRLIAALEANGIEVRTAFWAKPTEEDKWYLYLASPFVDERGGAAAYDLIIGILRDESDLFINRFGVRVLRLDDSLATAALAVLKSQVSTGLVPGTNSKPYTGMTRIYGSTFGGLSIDGAFLYPMAEPSVPA